MNRVQAKHLVERMLRAPLPDAPRWRSQLHKLSVEEPVDGNYRLTPTSGEKAGGDRGVFVDAEAIDEDGQVVFALLHVIDGWLFELQLYRGDGQHPKKSFVPEDFEIVYPPPTITITE